MVKKKEENKEGIEEIEETEVLEEVIAEENNCDISQMLELKDKEIEYLNKMLLSSRADFINFRKRAEKEKERTITYALECFVIDLLPIIDNFERAIEFEANKDHSFYQGVEMIYQQLFKALKDNGVNEVEALGKDFNPNFHHAVDMKESDKYDSGKVTEVLQKGYFLKDKVIRPTTVYVAK